MAMTLLGVPKKDRENIETAYYLSQEYSPAKDKDTLGNIVPNQEWQHPVPETLSYCRLGVVTGTDRTDGILKALLTLGTGQMGGLWMIAVDGKNRRKMSDMPTILRNSRKSGGRPSHSTHTVIDANLPRNNA